MGSVSTEYFQRKRQALNLEQRHPACRPKTASGVFALIVTILVCPAVNDIDPIARQRRYPTKVIRFYRFHRHHCMSVTPSFRIAGQYRCTDESLHQYLTDSGHSYYRHVGCLLRLQVYFSQASQQSKPPVLGFAVSKRYFSRFQRTTSSIMCSKSNWGAKPITCFKRSKLGTRRRISSKSLS